MSERQSCPSVADESSTIRSSLSIAEPVSTHAQTSRGPEPDWVTWTERQTDEERGQTLPSRTNRCSRCSRCSQCPRSITTITSDTPLLLLYSSVVLNTGILASAIFVYATTSSQLVLAQAADSFLDVGANLVIAYAARVSRRPADVDHLYGHQRAEPIGALIVAVITVVVALEVCGTAIISLVNASYPLPDDAIGILLGVKGGLKLGMIGAILLATSFHPSQNIGLNALFIDTRNDVVACACSLGGFALIRAGYGWGDGLLAILLSMYVAYNGVDLGRDNLTYLMGGAPSRDVFDELRSVAQGVDGVLSVGRIRAQYIGPDLQVDVCIVVASELLVRQAHDVSIQVQRALEGDERVVVAFVHVDTNETVRREH